MPVLHRIRGRTSVWLSTVLVGTGLVSGAILGSTLTAGASTSSSTSGAATVSSTGSSNSAGSSTSSGSPAGPPNAAYKGLPDTGTVTAIGSNTVTIGGKTYAVTSSSDIDKNGEASLSSLAVGDSVTFSTVSSASTPTIDKLHAGNETLDRPAGPPPGGVPSYSGSSSPVG
jgi:hypothetical protein